MAAPFDENHFFTTLLQSGGHEEGSILFNSIDDNVLDQASHSRSGERMAPSKKNLRGVSFTVEKDTLLVSAWLNITIDAIRGTNQKHTQMWERIGQYCNQYKKPNSQFRSDGSLTNRWQCIKKCTNKFCATVAQVESLHSSGATEHDKLEKAKILYNENEKAKFTMKHCWCLLRHQPKWQQHMSMMNTRRKPPGRCPTSNASTPLANDTPDENVEIIDERPLGKKSEKERERKRKSRETEDADFNKALSRMTEDRTVCMLERREAVTKAESDRMSLLALKKKKVDIEIMKLDLDGMNAMQHDYFQTLQKEVYEEMKNRSTSPSTPFGGK